MFDGNKFCTNKCSAFEIQTEGIVLHCIDRRFEMLITIMEKIKKEMKDVQKEMETKQQNIK